MQKWLGFVLLACLSAEADKITMQTLACKQLKDMHALPKESMTDYTALNRYVQTHDCIVVSESDDVQVVRENGTSLKGLFYRIVVARTGERYYVQKSAVQLEQPGKKNTFSF